MEMPFWLIRLKTEPFEVAVKAVDVSGRFEITVDELERYGLPSSWTTRRAEAAVCWSGPTSGVSGPNYCRAAPMSRPADRARMPVVSSTQSVRTVH